VPSRVRTKLSDVAASLDDFVSRLAFAALSWLLWPFLQAIGLGSTIWAFRHLTQVPALDTNKLTLPDNVGIAGWMASVLKVVGLDKLPHSESVGIVWTVVASLLVIGLAHLVVNVVVRRRTGEWRVTETGGELKRRLFPLIALPILPMLTLAKIEQDSPKETFFYIVLFAAAIGAGVYGWSKPAGEEAEISVAQAAARLRRHRIFAAVAVAAIWATYGIFFSRLSIVNHHALNTRTIDLGYYDNIFYQSIHGRPLGCSLIKAGYHGSAHFDPILVLLSPLYLLYPRAEMLLVLQAVWLGAGVVPVYLIAFSKLGRRVPAVLLAAMYALYPALHGANMYEFHSLSLLSSILLWLIYFLEKGNRRAYYLVLIPALLCREDVALILCFISIYAILSRKPGAARLGWTTIGVSLLYFVIVKKFFMTSADIFMSGKDSLSFAYYYEDLIPNKNGVAGIVVSVVTNPLFVVKTMVAEAKIVYLLTLFVPLCFLPFMARTSRIMLGYGLLFTLLATRTAVFSPAFQYSATLIPFAFALTPIALRQMEDGSLPAQLGLDGRRLANAFLGAALASSLLVSWKFGGFLENQAFRGGFSRVARGLTPAEKDTYRWIDETVALIPAGASVGTTNKLGCHVSNRKDAVFYPGHGPVDYVFLDETEIKGADLDGHNKAVQTGKLVQVARRDKMALFKSTEKKPAPGAPATASASAATSASAAPPAVVPPPVVVPPAVPAPPVPVAPTTALGSAIAPAVPVRAPVAPLPAPPALPHQ
jgi:uncharacterized membrane protein